MMTNLHPLSRPVAIYAPDLPLLLSLTLPGGFTKVAIGPRIIVVRAEGEIPLRAAAAAGNEPVGFRITRVDFFEI